MKVVYDDWKGDYEAQHYHNLQKKLDEVFELTVIFYENGALVWNMMDEFQLKINKNESTLRCYSLTSTNATGVTSNIECCNDFGKFCKASGESNEFHSPLAIGRHGCPPKNRRIYNVEKFASKKKKDVKTKKKWGEKTLR